MHELGYGTSNLPCYFTWSSCSAISSASPACPFHVHLSPCKWLNARTACGALALWITHTITMKYGKHNDSTIQRFSYHSFFQDSSPGCLYSEKKVSAIQGRESRILCPTPSSSYLYSLFWVAMSCLRSHRWVQLILFKAWDRTLQVSSWWRSCSVLIKTRKESGSGRALSTIARHIFQHNQAPKESVGIFKVNRKLESTLKPKETELLLYQSRSETITQNLTLTPRFLL